MDTFVTKEHFDQTIKKLDEKIDSTTKQLDEKIDSTAIQNGKNVNLAIDQTIKQAILELENRIKKFTQTQTDRLLTVLNKYESLTDKHERALGAMKKEME